MLDRKYIRSNVEELKRAAAVKNIVVDLDVLMSLDQEVEGRRREIDAHRAELKRRSQAFRDGAGAREDAKAESRKLGDQIQELEAELRSREAALNELLAQVPNPPHPSVPVGASADENVPIRFWGTPPSFDFEPRDHVELMERLEMVDLSRGAKVAGSRGYVLKGWGALLEQAVLRFGMDRITRHNFVPLRVPSLVREYALFGTGQFPRGREQTYELPRDNLFLAGTAEVAVTGIHSGEILAEDDLPLTYAALSPCFRREAGSAGRDVRGIFRVHEFIKLEQYVVCRNDASESERWQERLLAHSEEIIQALELPYRIVNAVTGDLGPGHVKMLDLECWYPGEGRYRENYSASIFYDWQARRANLRYRDREGTVRFCHTVNNTVVATPRLMIPLCEVHQRADGSIRIPDALQPYLATEEITAPWGSAV
ncbi:MAG: serine--tRNA ligase [Gammaproteobacteria bacterium]